MLAVAAALLLTANAPQPHWFGPATATFTIQFPGNPYDPAINEVHVKFLGEKGQQEERIAYFDPEDNVWRAVLVAGKPGTYRAILVRNGVELQTAADEGYLTLDKELPHGFIRVNPTYKDRFQFDDQTSFTPCGFNLGWQDKSILPMDQQIAKMGKAGVSWTRIWSSNWGGMNPWWTETEKLADGDMYAGAFTKWGKMVAACEASGVNFQMVLHNHGAFSSTTNANWQDHPWNAKNGGFLADAADFFTNAEAKRRAKLWLRYAVARYASSPQLMAWELFNEVEWVDASKNGRWTDVENWHNEMAEYIRSIDPYKHLITSSSHVEQKGLWKSLDYYQPHTYPADVFGNILYTEVPGDKPLFFGEFGPEGQVASIRSVVRNGLLAGILANQAAPGMYWSWDVVEKEDLYSEFSKAKEILELSNWSSHPLAKMRELKVTTDSKIDLTFAPGLGWASTTKNSFSMPDDAVNGSLSEFSSYFQGTGHKDMMSGTPTFHFLSEKPGKATFKVGETGQGGANLTFVLNGTSVQNVKLEKGASKVIVVEFTAGNNTISVENSGEDWARVDSISIEGISPSIRATALPDVNWMIVRVTGEPGSKGVISAPLANGQYERTVMDMDTGKTRIDLVNIEGFRLPVEKLEQRDAVWILKQK